MSKGLKFSALLLFWGAFLLSFSGSASGGELENKIKEYEKGITELSNTLSSSSNTAKDLGSKVDKLITLVTWIKDKSSADKSWAEKSKEDLDKARECLKHFESYDKLCKGFPKKLKDYQKNLERDLKSQIRLLEQEKKRLQPDLKKLDQSEKWMGNVYKQMEKTGKNVNDYLFKNKDMEELKKYYDKITNYSAKTTQTQKLEKSIKSGASDRGGDAKEELRNLYDSIKDVTKGVKYPPFDKAYSDYKEALDLLRKNAKEVQEKNKRLVEFRKKVNENLKKLEGKIKEGKIKDSMNEDVNIYKDLLKVYEEMKKSKVFKALETDWIPKYGSELKSLYPSLKVLQQIQKKLDTLIKDLKTLPGQAEKDLKTFLDSPSQRGDYLALGKALDELQKKHLRINDRFKREAGELTKLKDKVQFQSSQKEFKSLEESLKKVYNQWIKDAKEVWKATYEKPAPREALLGKDARDGSFSRAVQRTFEVLAKNLERDLAQWSNAFKYGNLPSNASIGKYRDGLKNVEKWCSQYKSTLPKWWRDLDSDILELEKCLKGFSDYQKEIDQLIQDIQRFRQSCASKNSQIGSMLSSAQEISDMRKAQKQVQENKKKAQQEWKDLITKIKASFNVGKKALEDKSSTPITGRVYENREKWLFKETKRLAGAIDSAAKDEEVHTVLRGIVK